MPWRKESVTRDAYSFSVVPTQIQAWLPLIERNGPRLVSLAFTALIAVELARVSLTVLGAAPVAPVEIKHLDSRGQSRIDLPSIVAAHLFGVANDPTQDPAEARPTGANLVLAGIIATEDPKHGIAIIGGDGPAKVYSVGGDIGGASLHLVYLDHVVLNRSGTLETLALPHRLAATGAVQPLETSRAGAGAGSGAGQVNSRSLDNLVRVGGSAQNSTGKLRGFRIFPGNDRLAFIGSGLKGGDLVVAINGAPLEERDWQTGQKAFDTIRTSSGATLTVERFGQKRDILIDAAQ